MRPPGTYSNWHGAHWVLGALADLGYPRGNEALFPLREQVLNTWLHESYYRDVDVAAKSAAYRRAGVPVPRGRHRVQASQQGYALWFLARWHKHATGQSVGHRRRSGRATRSETFHP